MQCGISWSYGMLTSRFVLSSIIRCTLRIRLGNDYFVSIYLQKYSRSKHGVGGWAVTASRYVHQLPSLRLFNSGVDADKLRYAQDT